MVIDKYYTPSIEEFHVGFECEIKNSSDPVNFDWELFRIIGVDDAEISYNGKDWSLMDWSFYDSQNSIREETIRVKYLDKADIEDLGFKCTKEEEYEGKPCFMFFEKDSYNSSKLIIEWYRWWVGSKQTEPVENRLVKIYRTEGIPIKGPDGKYGGVYAEYFKGNIKNKSELKRLIKQLGIE